MEKREIILAAFAPSKGDRHTPVQVQKLLFLIDREIPALVGGPLFDFQPYDYGPFDKAVYEELEQLRSDGYVDIIPENTWLSYKLTTKGQRQGDMIFNTLDVKAQRFISEASEFVRSLSFVQLVSAIYKTYPEMRQNSVFQACT